MSDQSPSVMITKLSELNLSGWAQNFLSVLKKKNWDELTLSEVTELERLYDTYFSN